MRRGTNAYRLTSTPANFPVPWTDDFPPPGSGCYEPIPPPIFKMNCKFHLKGEDHDVLDSTPIVANPGFCDAIGMGELEPGVVRIQCPIRPEGWEFGDRRACEDWRVGTSKNSNSPGPTWTNPAGELCKGPATGCQVSPDTPYQLWVYKRTGIYTVCAQTGKCCPVDIDAER